MGRILVIEDDPNIRTALRAFFRRAGHSVTVASTGAEGAKRYSRAPTDVVITDIMMPGKDGIEVLLELRADFPDIKVIAISGEARDLLPVAQDLGFRHTFSKPLDLRGLLLAVEELLTEEPR